MGLLCRRDHLAILTYRHFAFALALAGCAEAPFGEGEPPDEECGASLGVSGGNGALELGRLQGGTFVPLVGGETFELAITGDPYGWGFFVAARLGLESPPTNRTGCMSFRTAYTPVGTMLLMQSSAPAHPAVWTEDPSAPSIGRWGTVGEARLVIGPDIEPLLATPLQVTVFAAIDGVTVRSPELMLRFTNSEGFLAD